MTDALALLEARCKKLTSRVEKLRAQLEAAEKELADNETAYRVLSQLPVTAGPEESRGSSHDLVLAALPTTERGAMTPREVYNKVQASGGTVSADNVRTILSRLKKDDAISSHEGRYWRKEREPEPDIDDFEELRTSSKPSDAALYDDDLDYEVPF